MSCVGDGEDTLFWHDRWCGDAPLRVRFSRLFDLTLNKSITVKDMFLLGWGEGGDAWRWRRRLWEWEEELLEECRLLLVDVSLQPFTYDVWQWLRRLFDLRCDAMLTTHDTPQDRQDVDLIWHKQVPVKVSIFAWRLLRDRLPTKSNLVTRSVIDSEASLCVWLRSFGGCPTFVSSV